MHLKNNYPNLFSLAMRTNPFDPKPTLRSMVDPKIGTGDFRKPVPRKRIGDSSASDRRRPSVHQSRESILDLKMHHGDPSFFLDQH